MMGPGCYEDPHRDPDREFASQQLSHHQYAVEDAKKALEEIEDPALKALANRVIASSSKEVVTLAKWLAKRWAQPDEDK